MEERPKKHKRSAGGDLRTGSGSRTARVETLPPQKKKDNHRNSVVNTDESGSDPDDSTIEKSQLFAKLNEMQKAIAGYKESKERAKSPNIVQKVNESIMIDNEGPHSQMQHHPSQLMILSNKSSLILDVSQTTLGQADDFPRMI